MIKSLALALCLSMHPVHVSLMSIEHIPDTDSIKVFIRMYYDDFLLDYKLFDKDADTSYLSQVNSFPENLMSKYLDEKVNIIVNNKHLQGKLITLELAATENEIMANLFYHTDNKPEIVSIKNEIMTGLYFDQANMTIIRVNGFEEGVKLTPEKTEQTFVFK